MSHLKQTLSVLGLGAGYFLGILSHVGLLSPATAMADVSIDESGITYPDGNLQTIAYQSIYQSPEEVFHSGCSVTKDTASSLGRCDVGRSIPAGKRLVIETVTGAGWADNYVLGTAYLGYHVANGSDVGSQYVVNGFPWVAQDGSPSERRFFGFNHPVRLYVDGPRTLQFNVMGGWASGTITNYSLDYAVSGYLVDLIPY